MRIFDFFKSKQNQPGLQEKQVKEKYWMLTTNEDTIYNPNWQQIKKAVEDANPTRSVFASLAYMYANIDIETIQVMEEEGIYRFEVLPSPQSNNYGKIFVNDTLTYEETLKLFEEFYNQQTVSNYKNWNRAT